MRTGTAAYWLGWQASATLLVREGIENIVALRQALLFKTYWIIAGFTSCLQQRILLLCT